MDPAASCSINSQGTRGVESNATPTGEKNNLKRKLEASIDLTEDEDLNNCKGKKKKSQANAGAKIQDFEKVVDDEKPFHALNDHSPRKRAKSHTAESAQTNHGWDQEQPLFECGTCRKPFESIAELHDHDIEHKQQPRIRCRKCRKNFTDIAERNHHFQTSPRHFCCRYCEQVVQFGNADSLRYHYIDRHNELYCHFCDQHFPNTFQRHLHMEARHRSCLACRKMFPVPELHHEHCRSCYSAKFGEAFPEGPDGDGDGGRLPNHYRRLGISGHSSHEEVLKTAKEMRVKTHPDRLKRRAGLTEEEKRAIDAEAALVGQAADVLSDPDLRLEYDRKMHGL